MKQSIYKKPPKNLHQHVVDELGALIVCGKIEPGEVLPVEATLAESFGVSRTVVREAVKVLMHKRLLQVRTRTGTCVLPSEVWNHLDPDILRWRFSNGLTPKLLSDITELRRVVEPAVAELAARRATPAALRKIEDALQDMTNAISIDGHIAADLRFHAGIMEAAGNDLLSGLRYGMEGAWNPSIRLSTQSKADAESTCALHKALFDAIAVGDPVAARLATDRLIDRWADDGGHIMAKDKKSKRMA
jgi:DNA-binding FadR family transcriptional regulator